VDCVEPTQGMTFAWAGLSLEEIKRRGEALAQKSN